MFYTKLEFLLSDDNKSKNYPIVMKFDTDVAFIYRQIEFVQKNLSIMTKDICGYQ